MTSFVRETRLNQQTKKAQPFPAVKKLNSVFLFHVKGLSHEMSSRVFDISQCIIGQVCPKICIGISCPLLKMMVWNWFLWRFQLASEDQNTNYVWCSENDSDLQEEGGGCWVFEGFFPFFFHFELILMSASELA